MLASINPLGERARNQRYGVTVAAYIVGSTAAGALLGGVLGFVGAQLGLAFVTIVTASATWVAFACALLSGSALAGVAIGAIFGIARAVPILAASKIGNDPSTLRALVR